MLLAPGEQKAKDVIIEVFRVLPNSPRRDPLKPKLLFCCILAAVVMFATLPVLAQCVPTGFFRDGINMTATLINPPAAASRAVNASGCNIGVYYNAGKGTVQGADISGANYFGVVVNGATIWSRSTLLTTSSTELANLR